MKNNLKNCCYTLASTSFFLCMSYPPTVEKCVKPGSLVFDVGAHEGKKTKEYLERGAKQVICFEPQSHCARNLRTQFVNNNKVIIEQCGLANLPGHRKIYICEDSDGISTCCTEWITKSRFFQRNYQWNKEENIRMETLDAMIIRHGLPYFCKIDVENFEYEVLCGLSFTIPYISIEHHVETTQKSIMCLQRLSDIGFTHFNFSIGESGEFITQKWMNKEDLLKVLTSEAQRDHNNIWGLWGDIYAWSPSGEYTYLQKQM